MNTEKICAALSQYDDKEYIRNRATTLANRGLQDEAVAQKLISYELENGKPANLHRCEILDKVNLMCRRYMDLMARYCVEYDFEIDADAFRTVVLCLFEQSPFFHSTVCVNPIVPYWQAQDYSINDVIEVAPYSEEKKYAFWQSAVPYKSNIQMKILLMTSKTRSAVVLKWNHMIMDGGGFKEFMHDIARAYTAYKKDGVFEVDFRTGKRNLSQVYSDMPFLTKLKARLQLVNIFPSDKHIFPFTAVTDADRPLIAHKKIDSTTFLQAKRKAKELGSSANDMLTAAFMDAYRQISGMGDESLNVSSAVDLRRYLNDPSKLGYTNLVAFMHCPVDCVSADIRETLRSVTARMNKNKNDRFLGLHGLPLLSYAYTAVLHCIAEPMVRLFYSNARLSMSNLGPMDGMFSMDGNPLTDAMVAGAAKEKPYAMVTLLTIRNELVLTMSFKGNDEDLQLVNRFFDAFEQAMKKL